MNGPGHLWLGTLAALHFQTQSQLSDIRPTRAVRPGIFVGIFTCGSSFSLILLAVTRRFALGDAQHSAMSPLHSARALEATPVCRVSPPLTLQETTKSCGLCLIEELGSVPGLVLKLEGTRAVQIMSACLPKT